LQHQHRVGVFPTLVAGRKPSAEIAETRRAEQRIRYRVRQNVGVGMSERPAFERNVDAAQHQRAAFDQRVRVETMAGAR
jgi:hypothetical protein